MKYKDHYLAFAEFNHLNDQSITLFINTAEAIDRIPNSTLRAEATGIFQAQSGLWQILARQGQIPVRIRTTPGKRIFHPFADIPSLRRALRCHSNLARRAHARGDRENPPISRRDD